MLQLIPESISIVHNDDILIDLHNSCFVMMQARCVCVVKNWRTVSLPYQQH